MLITSLVELFNKLIDLLSYPQSINYQLFVILYFQAYLRENFPTFIDVGKFIRTCECMYFLWERYIFFHVYLVCRAKHADEQAPQRWSRVLKSSAEVECWSRVLEPSAGAECWSRVLEPSAGTKCWIHSIVLSSVILCNDIIII